jgi:hypothetical protein
MEGSPGHFSTGFLGIGLPGAALSDPPPKPGICAVSLRAEVPGAGILLIPRAYC